jgi:hypothetical protein
MLLVSYPTSLSYANLDTHALHKSLLKMNGKSLLQSVMVIMQIWQSDLITGQNVFDG